MTWDGDASMFSDVPTLTAANKESLSRIVGVSRGACCGAAAPVVVTGLPTLPVYCGFQKLSQAQLGLRPPLHGANCRERAR